MSNKHYKLHTVAVFVGLCCLFFAAGARRACSLPAQPPMLPPQAQRAWAGGACENVQQRCVDLADLWLLGSNFGILGLPEESFDDPYTETCDHPGYTGLRYSAEASYDFLFLGALWVGAIVGDDTLVTTGHDGWVLEEEFQAGSSSADTLRIRSSDPWSPHYSEAACAPLEIVAGYQDTALATLCPRISPNHLPLQIDVREIYRSWTDQDAGDMILIDGTVTNIGTQLLRDAYIGYYIDGDVGPTPANISEASANSRDDIVGRRSTGESGAGFDYAWIADYDGPEYRQPSSGDSVLVPYALALALLDTPGAARPALGFNWWLSDSDPARDWGPGQPFPDGGSGTPQGDSNKYRLLCGWQNATLPDSLCVDPPGCDLYVDPDQLNTERDGDPVGARDTRFLASFGPFTIAPGDSASYTIALVTARIYPQEDPDLRDFSELDARVEAARILYDEMCHPTGIEEESGSDATPAPGAALGPAEPNPFNPRTAIPFHLGRAGRVQLAIYDRRGARIRTLVDGMRAAGDHRAVWDGRADSGNRVASGVYIVRLRSAGTTTEQKLILAK